MKELKISAIREGTVIDHIPSKDTFKIAEILGLKCHGNVVTIAMNLKSKKMGSKGIIKVGGKHLSEEEVNKIALIAPRASMAIIKEYNVDKKIKLKCPDKVEKVVKCSNPKCVTNEGKVDTRFSVISKEPLKVRCDYCERCMESEEIVIL